MERHYQQLITLFAECFQAEFNTRLVAGDDEPFYQPAVTSPQTAEQAYHKIVFAHGFFASALHEIAHWCIAGPERRLQFDYGYWYAPDGRNSEQQSAFEQAELKPQALEWLFADAAGVPFQVSVDNLSGVAVDRTAFTARVSQQRDNYLRTGLPARAQRFYTALADFYDTNNALKNVMKNAEKNAEKSADKSTITAKQQDNSIV